MVDKLFSWELVGEAGVFLGCVSVCSGCDCDSSWFFLLLLSLLGMESFLMRSEEECSCTS